jgi:hypothetical protein
MRSLEKRAVDMLVAQLLAQIPRARIVGPTAPLTALDERYVGRLKTLLADALPGVPEPVLSSIHEDLIVVQRASEQPSQLVGWEASVMRVERGRAAADIRAWKETYGDLLSIDIQASKYLETDLKGATLTFSEQFFAPRSIQGWRRLSVHFARVCEAMAQLMAVSGLKQRDVNQDRDTSLIPTNLVSVNGDAMELVSV